MPDRALERVPAEALALPDPEPGYVYARLDGGPMHGEVILAPMDGHPLQPLPERVIGVLAPLLDESAETFDWTPVTYLFPVQKRPEPGEPYRYVSVKGARNLWT